MGDVRQVVRVVARILLCATVALAAASPAFDEWVQFASIAVWLVILDSHAWVLLLVGVAACVAAAARRRTDRLLGELFARCPLCLRRPLHWRQASTLPPSVTAWRMPPLRRPPGVDCPACGAEWGLGWRSWPARTVDWLQLRAAGDRADRDLVPVLVMMRKPSQWLSWVRCHANEELDARETPVLPPLRSVPAPVDSASGAGLGALVAVARRNAQRSIPQVGWGVSLLLRVALIGVLVGALALTRSSPLSPFLLAPIIAVAILGDRQGRAHDALLSIFARCPLCLHREIWWDMRLGRARDRVGCAACGAEWEMGRQVRLLGTLNRLALAEPGTAMIEEVRQSLPTSPSPADWRRWVEGRMAAVLDAEGPMAAGEQAV